MPYFLRFLVIPIVIAFGVLTATATATTPPKPATDDK